MTQAEVPFETLLSDGFAALRAGERERAFRLLAQAVRRDPNSERAWLLLAGALTDVAQQRTCLERALQINPQNEMARRGLAALTPPPAPAPTAPAPPTTPAAPAPLSPPSPIQRLAATPTTPAAPGNAMLPRPPIPVRAPNRLVWTVVLAVGIILMLASLAYAGAVIHAHQAAQQVLPIALHIWL